jgi:NAD-dependent deacetylase
MKVFVLTGAGVSAESGLGTFRDKSGTGLWARFDPMKLATPEAFACDPDAVHEFYNFRRRNLLAAAPNAAHSALALMERELTRLGGALTLVTQNIDDLHERAGAGNPTHMHGELLKARCVACHALNEQRDDLSTQSVCPSCRRVGTLRPHVVWFGETPLFMEEIAAALSDATLFVSIGTSGSVYPAAGLVSQARARGVSTCELNLEPSDNAAMFDDRRYGAASAIVPAWVEATLANF